MNDFIHAFEIENEKWDAELGERVASAIALGERGAVAWLLAAQMPWTWRTS